MLILYLCNIPQDIHNSKTIRQISQKRSSSTVPEAEHSTNNQKLSYQSKNKIVTNRPSEVANTQNSRNSRKESHKSRRLPYTYDPDSDNRNLIRYNTCIQEEGLLVMRKSMPFKDNISKELRLALKKLKDRIVDKEIIITKADKGSGLVVLDYDLYIKKGTHYIEIESLAYKRAELDQRDIITKIVKERNKLVVKLKKANIIQEETATYCTHQVEEKITGMKFYYKVHKDSNIHTMPLRPLQSCILGPTHYLSQVLTDILQPLLTVDNIPTFIQDSNQLLVRLSQLPTLDKTDTIITSDVAALYPSIPHKEGLGAMKSFLLAVSEYNKDQVNLITEHMRYIDDNLFIVPEQQIGNLIDTANSILSPSIRYTYEALDKEGEKELPFLDTQLFISEELKIESRLYTKKTDKHAYLLPSSFHPAHIARNIPLSTFYRLRRICSKEEWFKADVMLAIEWLEDRDYKYKDITKAIGKAIDKDRWELINNIEENRGKRKISKPEDNHISTIPLITTYSHKTLLLKEVLKQRQEILDASFTNTKVVPRLSFRRQNNIGDILVQKSLRGPITGDEQVNCKFVECDTQMRYRIHCPCKGSHDQKKCRCCMHACFDVKDIKVRLYKEVTCESKNIVYHISCKVCKKRYVGETQQKLRDRLVQHLNNIQKLNQPLYTHFKSVHKPIELSITVLETMRSEEPFMRKIREAWWINKLQTLEPKGFNVKLECNQMYLEDRKRSRE